MASRSKIDTTLTPTLRYFFGSTPTPTPFCFCSTPTLNSGEHNFSTPTLTPNPKKNLDFHLPRLRLANPDQKEDDCLLHLLVRKASSLQLICKTIEGLLLLRPKYTLVICSRHNKPFVPAKDWESKLSIFFRLGLSTLASIIFRQPL